MHYMDSQDRPELRLWKVLWPASLIAGMSMIVRLMHVQYTYEHSLGTRGDGWSDPLFGIIASAGVCVLAAAFVLDRIRPRRLRMAAVGMTILMVGTLWAASFLPDMEAAVPVNAVLAVPVFRGLRLPVLVPRGRKLFTWAATVLSFFFVPLTATFFALGDRQLVHNQAGNTVFVLASAALLAWAYAALLIGKDWRNPAWRGPLMEFIIIQMMVSVAVRWVLAGVFYNAL